jgi:glycosyltransferase involved in cell wall biosynthesis
MDFVDVDSDKWTQYSKYAGFPKSWIYALEGRRLADYERRIAEAFDHSIFVTQAEVEVFKKLNPHIQSVIAISNGVDLDYFSPSYLYQGSTIDQGPATKERGSLAIEREPSTINHGLSTMDHRPTSIDHRPVLVFTGAMDYYANIDGVVWFTKEVLPLVKKEIPDVKFYIVGSNPTKEVIELSGKNGMTVTGYVPDTREYLRRATVAVVPLRIARGIQNKILEAMAMGIPVVSTPQAFEGIEAEPEVDLMLADNAKSFSRRVIQLLRDMSLRKHLGDHARNTVENKYSWAKNLGKLDEVMSPYVSSGCNTCTDSF